jgi:hypothetical protein
MSAKQNARALARWEGEGGRVQLTRREGAETSLETAKEAVVEKNRRVRQAIKSRATVEGAGVHLHRAIGFGPAGWSRNMERSKA